MSSLSNLKENVRQVLIFPEYLSLTEEEFYMIALSHTVSPWNFDVSQISSNKTYDYESWPRGNQLIMNTPKMQYKDPALDALHHAIEPLQS